MAVQGIYQITTPHGTTGTVALLNKKPRKQKRKLANCYFDLDLNLEDKINKLEGNDKILARQYLKRAYKPTYKRKLVDLLSKTAQ